MTSRPADLGDPTPTALDYEGHRIRLDGAMLSLTCGSAWNRDPDGGVIGVQTGPL